MQPTLEPVRQVHTHVATPLSHPHSHGDDESEHLVLVVLRQLTDFHLSAHVLQNAKCATWQYYIQQRTLQALTVIDNYTCAFVSLLIYYACAVITFCKFTVVI